jgi:hypothetical protein
MDSFRDYPTDFDLPAAGEVAQPCDVASAIGTDERRMHVRAYNHWVSLLRGRDFPSIEDLEPGEVEDFSSYSVLLDFTCGRDDPAIPYVGTAIRDECGLDDDMRTISDVPSRSLLSRLTDHYMQIIANRAPVGFEAEFENPAGATICYRGILMPFSSDGDAIDFIYGVINWKRVDDRAEFDSPAADLPPVDIADRNPEIEDALGQRDDTVEPTPPAAEPIENAAAVEEPIEHDAPAVAATSVSFSWEDSPSVDEDAFAAPEIVLDADAGLADRLWAARETAESVKSGEGRTRAALYKALSLAYDFAIAAEANPEEYSELLEESGVKAQARAPMTPIVKLVFGIDYDKARLTEFAAALSFAQRQDLPAGEFQSFVEKQAGGLKALVAAERQARRPDTKPDTKSDAARAKLRAAPTISLADVPAEKEFAILVTRRGVEGRHEPVGLVDDPALVERAIRRLA